MSCISLCVYFYISILGCFAGVFPWTLFLPQCRSHRCEPGRRLISVNSGSKMKLCGQTASAKSVLPRPEKKDKARYHIEALMINRTGVCAHHLQPGLVFWCVSACQNCIANVHGIGDVRLSVPNCLDGQYYINPHLGLINPLR